MCAQELPGDQAEDHCAQGGDETEGAVAATVGDEGLWAREKVEEPGIEGDAEVVGLPPVRGEGLAIERIERPGGEVGDEDGGEDEPLCAGLGTTAEEEEGVTEADLSQGVFEGEVGLFGIGGTQEDAHRNQDERAPEGMNEELREGSAFGEATGKRIGERDADQEGEGRLDHVVQRTAFPSDVGLVEGEEVQ